MCYNNQEEDGTRLYPLSYRIIPEGCTEDECFDEVHVSALDCEDKYEVRKQHWVLDCKHLNKHHG